MQLLVSDADVESYKQIKSDLDVLRQSVEKSELWVYKSNKPTIATVAPGSSQQLHNSSDEHQQQTSASITQTPLMTTDATKPVLLSSSVNASETTPSQQTVVEGAHVGQPTNTTEKTSYDIFTAEGSGGSGEEEFEDDEYKKIQKVTVSSDIGIDQCFSMIIFECIRFNLLCSQYGPAHTFEALVSETQHLLQIEPF